MSGFSPVRQDTSGKFGCPVLSGHETHMPSPVEPVGFSRFLVKLPFSGLIQIPKSIPCMYPSTYLLSLQAANSSKPIMLHVATCNPLPFESSSQ